MVTTIHPPMPNAVTGERRELAGRLRKLSYYVAGPAESAAPPLLLDDDEEVDVVLELLLELLLELVLLPDG